MQAWPEATLKPFWELREKGFVVLDRVSTYIYVRAGGNTVLPRRSVFDLSFYSTAIIRALIQIRAIFYSVPVVTLRN